MTFANHRDSLTFPKNSKTIGFVTYSQNGVDVPIVPVRVDQNYICDAFFNTVSNQGLTFPFGLLQNVLDTTKYLTWTGIEHRRDEILSDSYKSYSLPKLNIGDVDVYLAVDIWNVHNIAYIIFCLFITKAFYGSANYKYSI